MDDEIETTTSPEEQLHEAVANKDVVRVEAILEDMSPSEGLRAVLQLHEDARDELLTMVEPETAAWLVEEAPDEHAAAMLERLDAGRAADIIEELDSDVQADVMAELDEADAEAIMAHLDPEDAEDVRRLSQYADDTAGGLMTAEAFSFAVDETVGAVLRKLASEDDDFERYRGQHPYIIDGAERLKGVVSLRTLLTSKRSTKLAEVMSTPEAVSPDTSLSELEDLFDEHPFLGMPVVDEAGRLIGAVSRTAVSEALLERSEAEGMKRHGVMGDELRSMPLWPRASRRLSWLSANIVLNVIAASVISAYEETLSAVIAIAIFLPMVSDMSGCSGNQAVAVSLRELALGLVRPVDMLRVWLKEISVGLLNGLVLGVLIGLVAFVWKGNPWLGIVIGAALALNTLIAVSIGGIVPLILKRFGTDPAVASGPLLTTVTDMAGFFLVLSLASAMMPLLVHQ